MERNYSTFDVNALPVHLFVKSPKEAKKVDKQNDSSNSEPVVYKKEKRFKSTDYPYIY